MTWSEQCWLSLSLFHSKHFVLVFAFSFVFSMSVCVFRLTFNVIEWLISMCTCCTCICTNFFLFEMSARVKFTAVKTHSLSPCVTLFMNNNYVVTDAYVYFCFVVVTPWIHWIMTERTRSISVSREWALCRSLSVYSFVLLVFTINIQLWHCIGFLNTQNVMWCCFRPSTVFICNLKLLGIWSTAQ